MKSETVDLAWGREQAQSIYSAWKSTWSEGKKYGISGKPDAGTNQPNSPTVYASLQRHGFSNYSRKNRSAGSIEPEGEINEEDFANAKNKDAGFRGAGDVIRLIEELLTFERVLTDEIEFYEQVVMGILEAIENDTRTGRGATNPANILFNTIISFTPAKGDKKAVIERGEMYGHFLTPAYYEFRKDKAKRKEVNYDMPKPPKSWSSLKPNKAKPPMWLALFDPKDGLKKVLADIITILKQTIGPSPSESVVVTFNQRSAGNASQLSGIRQLFEKVLNNPEIYSGGASTDKGPRKGRLRAAIEEETLQVNENDLKILAPICEVIVTDGETTEKVKLNEVPNFEKIRAVNIRFPAGNHRTLNIIIRETMGEEFMNTFRRPGLPENISDGLTLKSETSVINAATRLLKLIAGDEK